jgi:hypothetical protein
VRDDTANDTPVVWISEGRSITGMVDPEENDDEEGHLYQQAIDSLAYLVASSSAA